MYEISLLGPYCIGLFVKKWNTSINAEDKATLRELIESENAVQANKAFTMLCKLTTYSVDKESFSFGGKDIWVYKCEPVINTALRLFNSQNNPREPLSYDKDAEKAWSDIRRDVTFYFAMMFKAKHFEQLPMPKFGLMLPDLGEEGTVDGALAVAKSIVRGLPNDLDMSLPPK